MATPQELASQPDNSPHLRLVGGLEEQQRFWGLLASRIGLHELSEPDEEEQTHVLLYEGNDIGAAAVHTRSIPLGNREVHAAEVEVFSTNEAYYHPGYLALIKSIIEKDPQLTLVNGAPGPEMAAVASDVSDCLPSDWVLEYTLIAQWGGVTATTFDVELLAAHLSNNGKAEHSFKRI